MDNFDKIKDLIKSCEDSYKNYQESISNLKSVEVDFIENFKKNIFSNVMLGKKVLSTNPMTSYKKNVSFFDWDENTASIFAVPYTNVFNISEFVEINTLSYRDVMEIFDIDDKIDLLKSKNKEFNEMFTEDGVYLEIIKVNSDYEDLDLSVNQSMVEQFFIKL